MNQGLPPDSRARLAQTKRESGFNIRRKKQLRRCRCGDFSLASFHFLSGTALGAEGPVATKDPAALRLGMYVVPTAGTKTAAERKL